MRVRDLLLALLGPVLGLAVSCTALRERDAPLPDGVELLTAHIEILGPG